ncbi:MAG: sigma-54 dependent transcriptional regulator [Gemmatimonadales bacterium]|nr:sigma-54 dependent transcriptional regulator [Gemmatimonadales bacterium]
MRRRRERILVVDDEELFRIWLGEQLRAAGFEVFVAGSRQDAVRLAAQEAPAVVLLDLKLPDTQGLAALEQLRKVDQDMTVIIMTAYGEVETAVAAVKAGAYQFLQKPLSFDQLLVTLDKALEAGQLRHQVASLREMHQWTARSVTVIARSPAMRGVMQWVEKVAAADPATVLLQGESGTGKDLIARAIHEKSPRRDEAFVQVPCTAIPENLIESELFGHERGAFSDARERKRGLLELADGGIVLLDEIGDVPLGVQAKLLSFIETRTFRRVGGLADLEVDVRIIAATNRDLAAAVRAEAFRPDLFYRINVLPQTLPTLRDRPDDIEPLALHFLDKLSREFRRSAPRMTPEAIACLREYDWPGNARELRNVIERVLLLEEGHEIVPAQLPVEVQLGGSSAGVGVATGGVMAFPAEGVDLEELERTLIAQALRTAGGNKTRAARLLRLTRDTLRYRLEKYGIV